MLDEVEVHCFTNAHLGGFKADYIRIVTSSRDTPEVVEGVKHLWFDYIGGDLVLKGAANLIRYLERRQIWKREAGWPVYLAGTGPYLAYTAGIVASRVEITILGAELTFQDVNGDAWWQEVILPRVRTL